MYRFDIHTAELHFENLIRMFPEHPVGYMYRAELVWWLALLDTANKSFQDNFNSFTEVAIKKGQALLAKNADDFYANLYTASAYGNKTRFCVTVTDQTLGAVRAAMAGNKYNRKALALRPDYKDCLLGIGAWDYFTGDLPALIKPFAWLLGARGDKEKGLAALREAAEKGEYAKIETRMVLLGVYLTRKEFNTYLELLRNLIRQYPSNPVFYFWMGRYFSQHELWEDGRQAFLSLLNGKPAGSHSQPEAWLFLGLARMEMGKRDPDSAMEHLGKALEYNRNDLNLQVRAHLYRGCCYDTKGNRPAAVAEYQQVKKLPPVETLHKDADRYLKRPFRW
jgi:tetratricopeptide (TPR) repeat protein